MRVLVTGATGFIGSHLARRLIAEGYEVYALIRPDSSTWRIGDILRSLAVIPCDLFDTEKLDESLEQIKPDLCVHLAWYAEPGKYLNSLENLRFLSASLRLATRLADVGCKRFVGAGTCFEYDTSLGYLSEGSPTMPSSLYAANKLGLWVVLERLAKTIGMDVTWLRFFYLYGTYEDERRLVPYVICSLLRGREAKVTKGDQIRDFLHVEDAASAVWAVIQSKLSGLVNVGSGKPVAVRDIVAKIGTILDRSELIAFGAIPYTSSDSMFFYANNHLLTDRTSWVQQYDLEEGLRYTVEWWKDRFKIEGLHGLKA